MAKFKETVKLPFKRKSRRLCVLAIYTLSHILNSYYTFRWDLKHSNVMVQSSKQGRLVLGQHIMTCKRWQMGVQTSKAMSLTYSHTELRTGVWRQCLWRKGIWRKGALERRRMFKKSWRHRRLIFSKLVVLKYYILSINSTKKNPKTQNH